VPNGVDLEVFDRVAAEHDGSPPAVASCLSTIERMRRDGRFVYAYVGALGRVNEVATIVRAATLAEARSPGRIGVVLVGDGPERLELEGMTRDLDAVALAEPIPKASVPVVLRAIDGGVVHATANPVYRYGISFNKLFEYLAAGRPVIFACDSAYDPVAIAKAGISVPPSDPDRLADALLRLADTTGAARARMGAAGRAYVAREHDIERLADGLAAEIRTPARQPGG
jgi:glycosyltransferase involved in cell wall biosynthesis